MKKTETKLRKQCFWHIFITLLCFEKTSSLNRVQNYEEFINA